MTVTKSYGLTALLACVLLTFTGCVMEPAVETGHGWNEADSVEEGEDTAAPGSIDDAVLHTTTASLPTAYQTCGLEPDPRVYTDDTSTTLAYAGTWKAETPGMGLHQGTQHITNSGGSTVSHTFTTNGAYPSLVSYGYRKMRNAGKAAIYWDGQYFTTISLYHPDNVFHCELVLYDMPPGTHTLMVKALNQKEPASGGTYVNLDFFGNYEF
jgi:hypothetical protein